MQSIYIVREDGPDEDLRVRLKSGGKVVSVTAGVVASGTTGRQAGRWLVVVDDESLSLG